MLIHVENAHILTHFLIADAKFHVPGKIDLLLAAESFLVHNIRPNSLFFTKLFI